MRNNIKNTFEKCASSRRAVLTIFISCGDPSIEFTEKLVKRIVDSGADMVELGVPFSDPTADGATIQAAGQRALSGGVNIFKIFEMSSRLREAGVKVPLVLFSYINPLFKIGLNVAAKKSAESGIDAWLVVDAPIEESSEILAVTKPNGIDLIELASPVTSPERISKISNIGSGFLYYVMVAGVTGARKGLPADFAERINEVKKDSALPVGAGFGISSPETAHEAAQSADSVIVGSRFIDLVHSAYIKGGEQSALNEAADFVSGLSKVMSRD